MNTYQYYLDLVREKKALVNTKRELYHDLTNLDHQDKHLRQDILNEIERAELRLRELTALTLSNDS